MKKTSILVLGLLVTGCFGIVFFFAYQKTGKNALEVQKIHAASEIAIGKYLNQAIIPPVTFPCSPIYIDTNECILICFILTDSGKRRQEFEIFLERDKTVWQASILKVKPRPLIPRDKQRTPWELIWPQ
jgi:hypothetical protein